MSYLLSFTHNGQAVDVCVQGAPEALLVREIIEAKGYTVGSNPPLPAIDLFRAIFASK